MSRLPAPRSIRIRLLLSVVLAVGVALAVMIAGFNLLIARTLSHNADQILRARASAELALVRTEGGRLVVAETPDEEAVDTQAWVFAGTRVLEQPRASQQVAATARSLVVGPRRSVDVSGADTRLYAAPICFRKLSMSK